MATPNSLKAERRSRAITTFFGLQILGCFLIIACRCFTLEYSDMNVLGGFIFALASSEVSVLAIWMSLGDGSRDRRMSESLFGLSAIWLLNLGRPDTIEFVGIAMAIFVHWAVVLVPLWIGRRFYGWQFVLIDPQAEIGELKEMQFGIKHLVLGTTVVAIMLPISKAASEVELGRATDLVTIPLLLIFNSSLAWPAVFGSMTRLPILVALPIGFGFAMVITMSESLLTPGYWFGRPDSYANAFFGILNAIQFVWIAGSILILRLFGFRLVRSRKPDDE